MTTTKTTTKNQGLTCCSREMKGLVNIQGDQLISSMSDITHENGQVYKIVKELTVLRKNKRAIHKAIRRILSILTGDLLYLLPGSTCQGYLFQLTGRLGSRCKQTAAGFGNQAPLLGDLSLVVLLRIRVRQLPSDMSKQSEPKGQKPRLRCESMLGKHEDTAIEGHLLSYELLHRYKAP